MMGPVLRNLVNKKAVSIKELLCDQNKPFIAEQRGGGGGGVLRREDSLYLAYSSLACYNNVALISPINSLALLWTQVCIFFCR